MHAPSQIYRIIITCGVTEQTVPCWAIYSIASLDIFKLELKLDYCRLKPLLIYNASRPAE